jgi:hypothetical protein
MVWMKWMGPGPNGSTAHFEVVAGDRFGLWLSFIIGRVWGFGWAIGEMFRIQIYVKYTKNSRFDKLTEQRDCRLAGLGFDKLTPVFIKCAVNPP